MKQTIFIIIFTFAFYAFAFGQNPVCPAISITGPVNLVQPGEELDFTATVSGIDTGKVGYKWTVSEGKIVQGQGTPRVLVSIQGLYDNVIKITVEFLNLPEGCPDTKSETAVAACRCQSVLIESFGKLSAENLKSRLSALLPEIKERAEDKIYIVLYHPPKDNKNLDKKVQRIKKFFTENKISEDKFLIVFGGDEPKEITNIYLVPPGAEPPTP